MFLTIYYCFLVCWCRLVWCERELNNLHAKLLSWSGKSVQGNQKSKGGETGRKMKKGRRGWEKKYNFLPFDAFFYWSTGLTKFCQTRDDVNAEFSLHNASIC